MQLVGAVGLAIPASHKQGVWSIIIRQQVFSDPDFNSNSPHPCDLLLTKMLCGMWLHFHGERILLSPEMNHYKNTVLGAGEIPQHLRISFAEDTSSPPCFHGRWLTATCNSSSKRSDAIFQTLWAPALPHSYSAPSNIHILTTKILLIGFLTNQLSMILMWNKKKILVHSKASVIVLFP